MDVGRRFTGLGTALATVLGVAGALGGGRGPERLARQPVTASPPRLGARPAPCPPRWVGLLGRYGTGPQALLVLERGGRLEALAGRSVSSPLEEVGSDRFRLTALGADGHVTLTFTRDASGVATSVRRGGTDLPRQAAAVEGGVYRITPVRPLAELRREALAAAPPRERGPFRPADLVELTGLDPTIRFDVRYATADNFLGTPVYEAPRAFLQRPAAASLVRAHRALRAEGYGLLVHDAYRPWWVTKIFWDATPVDKREFVADPVKGSRHNRGCAVDLTLFRLSDGRPVEMPGVYDEMSERSYPTFPGGTSEQRWHRDLLRAAMEAEGFAVFESEWWHFDFRGWREYPILNLPFERIGPG
jgi:D-alanyl-D-alanine dipeptidase